MHVFPIYFAAALAVVTLAWFSKDTVREQLALLLAWVCIASQALVVAYGFDGAPRWRIGTDLVFTMLAATVGWTHRSNLALVVVGLFAAGLTCQMVEFFTSQQGTASYYVVLNAVYVLQLIVIGGSSGVAVALRFGWFDVIRDGRLGRGLARMRGR